MRTGLSIICTVLTLIPSCKAAKGGAAGNSGAEGSSTADITVISSNPEDFAINSYNILYGRQQEIGNMAYSPLSLSLALAALSQGACGDTYSQIASCIGFSGCTADSIGNYYRTLSAELMSADGNVIMESANSVWADKSLNVRESFSKALDGYFEAEAASVDMNDPGTADIINGWIERKTHGKIVKMISDTRNVLMALVNALYFKSAWTSPFVETNQEAFFTDINGNRVPVSQITSRGYFRKAENKLYRMAEVPFGHGRFVMDFIVPTKDSGKNIRNFDSAAWNGLLNSLEGDNLAIYMPEFKVEYGAKLNDLLVDMGMTDAFGASADFKGISDERLLVSSVLQKSYVDVNKDGVEAAAATVITLSKMSMREPDYHDFVIDSPFIFIIRDSVTGTILFIGNKVL